MDQLNYIKGVYSDSVSDDFKRIISIFNYTDKLEDPNTHYSKEFINLNLKYLDLMEKGKNIFLSNIKKCIYLAEIYNKEMAPFNDDLFSFFFQHDSITDTFVDIFGIKKEISQNNNKMSYDDERALFLIIEQQISNLNKIKEFSIKELIENVSSCSSEEDFISILKIFKKAFELDIRQSDNFKYKYIKNLFFSSYSYGTQESEFEISFRNVDHKVIARISNILTRSNFIRICKNTILTIDEGFALKPNRIDSIISDKLFDRYNPNDRVKFLFIDSNTSEPIKSAIDLYFEDISNEMKNIYEGEILKCEDRLFASLNKMFASDPEYFEKIKTDYYSYGDSPSIRFESLGKYCKNTGYHNKINFLYSESSVFKEINIYKENLNRFKSYRVKDPFDYYDYSAEHLSSKISEYFNEELDRIKEMIEADWTQKIDLDIFDKIKEKVISTIETFKKNFISKQKSIFEGNLVGQIPKAFYFKESYYLKKEFLKIINKLPDNIEENKSEKELLNNSKKNKTEYELPNSLNGIIIDPIENNKKENEEFEEEEQEDFQEDVSENGDKEGLDVILQEFNALNLKEISEEQIASLNNSFDFKRSLKAEFILQRSSFMGERNFKQMNDVLIELGTKSTHLEKSNRIKREIENLLEDIKEFSNDPSVNDRLRTKLINHCNHNLEEKNKEYKMERYKLFLDQIIFDYFKEETAFMQGKGKEPQIENIYSKRKDDSKIPASLFLFLDNAEASLYQDTQINSCNFLLSDYIYNIRKGKDELLLFWIKFFLKQSSLENKQLMRYDFETYLSFRGRLEEFQKNSESFFSAAVGSENYDYFINKFISDLKSSRLDTINGLETIERFCHNFSCHDRISKSKYFSKFRLKHYQILYEMYSRFDPQLRGKENPKIFLEKASEYKKILEQKGGKSENIANSIISIEDIIKLCECINNEIEDSFERMDYFIESFEKKFGEISSSTANKIHMMFSFILDFKDMNKYISIAEKKHEDVLKNNYQFISKNNYEIRFRTLQDLDPKYFSIGAETNCCQRIGGVGEPAAIDSFINPLAGVIILEIKIKDNWNLISQSYFHYVPELNIIILDNIETGRWDNDMLKKTIGMSFDSIYAILSKKMLDSGFSAVLCGKGYTLCLDFKNFKSGSFNSDTGDPRFIATSRRYSDFDEDDFTILSCPKFEIEDIALSKFSFEHSLMTKLGIYIAMNSNKKIIRDLSTLLVKKGFIKESIDLFYLQKNIFIR